MPEVKVVSQLQCFPYLLGCLSLSASAPRRRPAAAAGAGPPSARAVAAAVVQPVGQGREGGVGQGLRALGQRRLVKQVKERVNGALRIAGLGGGGMRKMRGGEKVRGSVQAAPSLALTSSTLAI